MNYYNPYFGIYPTAATTSSPGLFGRILGGGGIKWGSLLSGTQKVLGVANQAIPVIRQISPVMKNAKTMFKVMNEFKKVDTPTQPTTTETNNNTTTPKEELEKTTTQTEGPTFFI